MCAVGMVDAHPVDPHRRGRSGLLPNLACSPPVKKSRVLLHKVSTRLLYVERFRSKLIVTGLDRYKEENQPAAAGSAESAACAIRRGEEQVGTGNRHGAQTCEHERHAHLRGAEPECEQASCDPGEHRCEAGPGFAAISLRIQRILRSFRKVSLGLVQRKRFNNPDE